jgi:hypothetical protein
MSDVAAPVVTPTAPIVNAAAPVDTTPPVQTAKEAAVKASNKRTYNLKVDGNIEKYDLDLDNEEEVMKHLQLSKAASKRMQESAELKKGVQEFIEALRADPGKVLSDPRLNISPEARQKLAEAIINKDIEEMNKTPEQKEKERVQKEYETLKAQYEEEKKARADADFNRLQQEQSVQLDGDISSAIESGGLPKTARTVRFMAEAMMLCLQNNIDLTAKELVPYVKKQTLSEFKEMISSLPDEEFENWLGKDQISRIRKRSIQRAKAPGNPADIKATAAANVNKGQEKKEKIPMRDFMKKLGKF